MVYLRPDLFGSVSILEGVVGVFIAQARGAGVSVRTMCLCITVLVNHVI